MSFKNISISNKQFTAILVCCTWPTIINYGSGFLARAVGQDMWISGIISVLFSLLFIAIIIYVGCKFPGKTVIEYSRELAGTVFGKLLGLILVAYFTIGASNCVSMYIHHLTDFLLSETPFLVVTVLHLVVICYLVLKGPETIARMGVLAFFLAVVFYMLVFLASLPEIKFSRLLPFFDSGFLAVAKASLSADTFVGINPVIISMILPLVSNQKKALRSAVFGVSVGGFFFVFYFIVELMVMGSQVVALMRIASMDFVRSIQITQYLHRFESFMVGLWYWSMLVQAGILVYCSQEAFIQTFGIKKHKVKNILVFILGILIVILTYIIANDRVFFLRYREFMFQYIALPVGYMIPVILLILLLLKKAMHASSK